jgi:hypothetical protein
MLLTPSPVGTLSNGDNGIMFHCRFFPSRANAGPKREK